MDDKMKRMWKEATMVSFKALCKHLPAGSEENHEISDMAASLRAEI
jgi:hypothetical protein